MDSRETKSSRRASFVGSKRKHDLSVQIKSKRLKFEEKNKSLDRYLRPLECGWKRELVLRCISRGGKNKSADVYYYTPSGKKLRSMPQVVSYLQTNGNDDPSCKLSGENFVFYGEAISHHKNEWVRNARDRKAISPKKEKSSSIKSQPKPSLNIARRPVGRPKGKKKGLGSKPEPKLDDVTRVESGGTLTLASKVKVESNIGSIKVSPKKNKDCRSMPMEGCKSVMGLKSTGSVYILPSLPLPPESSSHSLSSSDNSSLSVAVAPPSISSARRVCNLRCPGLENVLPTLECRRCRCLFHPECVAFLGGHFEVANFFCECCKNAEQTGITGQSQEPKIKLPCKMTKVSNVSTSTNQKHRLIVPATAKVTTSSLNLSSLPRLMPEAIQVPVANSPTKFTGNSLSTQLNFTNPVPSLAIPFYASNNAYLSNQLSSYFVIPHSPNIYPQNGAFMTQSTVNMYPPSATVQSLFRTGYVNNVNSIFPNISFQASSVAPLATQSLNYQPLVPFCQTFNLGSKPIACLNRDSSQIQHNGFSTFNVATLESRPSSDPIVRPMAVQLTSDNKRLKKPKRSYKKSSANISDASCSNAESAPGNLEGRNPADEITAENSPVPLPLFVHNKTSAQVESTVSSNGVISKIILPTYDVLGSKNGGKLESISAADLVPNICPVKPNFSKKIAEESGTHDANLTRCTLNTFSTSREGNYSTKADAPNDVGCVRKNLDSTLNTVEEGLLTQSCTSDEGEDDRNFSRTHLDHDYSQCPLTEESSDDCDSSQNVQEFQEVKVDKEFDANLSIESETKDAGFPKTPPPSLNESMNSTISPASQDTTEASSQDLQQMSCLTDQLLVKVFQHLTTQELLMASQVCQRWRQVSQTKELWCSLKVTDDLFDNLKKNFDLWKFLAEQKPYLLDLRQMNFEKENLFLFAELLSSAPTEFLAGITTLHMSHCPLNLLKKIGLYLPNLNHLSVVIVCNSQGDGDNDGCRNGYKVHRSVGSYQDSFVKILTSLKSLKSLQIHWEELDNDTSSLVIDEDSIADEDEKAEFEPSSNEKVCRFAELKELELLGSSHISSLGFEKCLFSSTFDKLESVKVRNCLRWDEQMFSLLGHLVNLKILDLRRGGNIPDLGLSFALAKMKGLLQLKLSDYILDWSVSLAIQKLPNLARLHVRPETNHSGSDKAPYINLCCMSAMWNHKNLQQLTWVTSCGKSGPSPNGLLPFQVFDVSKLRGKKGLIDPLDDKEEGTPKHKMLLLSIDDLRSKLQTSLPNTSVTVIAV